MHKVIKQKLWYNLYYTCAVNSISKDKESIQTGLETALKGLFYFSVAGALCLEFLCCSEKDNIIISLQEDLKNATSSEVTRMSCHEEAAAILPMQSMTASDDNVDDDNNMQEMHQVY